MTRLGSLNVNTFFGKEVLYLCPSQIKGTRKKTEEEPKNVFWASLQGRANMPAVTVQVAFHFQALNIDEFRRISISHGVADEWLNGRKGFYGPYKPH